MKCLPTELKNLGNEERCGPLSSRAVICSVSESLAVAACCAVVNWSVEILVVRLEMSVKFCANSWSCWERIATIAGLRVEGGIGWDTGGMVTKIIGGALEKSDNGGGRGGGGGDGDGGGCGGTFEGLVVEEKQSMDDSN